MRLVEQIILADDDDGIAPVIRIMQMLLQTCADLFRLTDVDGIRIVLILPQQEIDAGVLGSARWEKTESSLRETL